MKLLFLDCETTGLDPAIHVPWEVAAVLAEHTDDGRLVELDRYEALVHLNTRQRLDADPVALEIGRFAERYEAKGRTQTGAALASWAIDALCDDRPHLVGAVPGFDDRRVGDMMRRCGTVPRWHYHLIDVEALAVGYLLGRGYRATGSPDLQWRPGEPWKSNELSLAVGVRPDDFDRHTAMGDVRWCMAQYAAVFGLAQERSE